MERLHTAGSVRPEPDSVGAGCLIQIAPQIRILVAVEPVDAPAPARQRYFTAMADGLSKRYQDLLTGS